MDRRNPLREPDNSTYSGLDNLGFDRPPPPAPPKRLQRLSRSTRGQQQQQQQHQHQQAVYAQPHQSFSQTVQPMQNHPERANTISSQHPQRESYRPPSHYPQQQQQQMRPRGPYSASLDTYRSSVYSNVEGTQGPPPPPLQGYQGSLGHQPSVQHSQTYPHPRQQRPQMEPPRPPMGSPPQQRPMPGLPGPYPSAMVVGGGMPQGSRLLPGPAGMSAGAPQQDINRQRERDFTNVVGRRRPTNDSMSSAGSSGSGHPHAHLMASVPEQPFNGNSSMDFNANGGVVHGRYRQGPGNQGTVDMRLGRSASSASSSSSGYRGGYAGPAYATQRRQLPVSPEHGQLRKQASAASMHSSSSASNGSGRYAAIPGVAVDRYAAGGAASPDLRNMHPGSRSAPDLNMRAMKDAINTVATNLDQNPVPKIPAIHLGSQPLGTAASAHAQYGGNYSQQLHQHHLHQQQQQQHGLHHPGHPPPSRDPQSSASLSIRTNLAPVAIGAVQPLSYSTLQPSASIERHAPANRRSSKSSDILASADPRDESAYTGNGKITPKTTGIPEQPVSAHGTIRSPPPPVNTELVGLLENVAPVYPAMLSAVAATFCSIMGQVLQTHLRNGLEYPQCFTGRDAVDTICAIIQTNDRNLAIVVGRALAQQKLFHDVEYERRLRDDPNELFAFEGDVANTRLLNGAMGDTPDDDADDEDASSGAPVSEDLQHSRLAETKVNGVFVMLTDCYSPTCSNTQPCYSVTCPRQRSQQDHLRKTAKNNVAAEMKQEKLWSMSVPKEVVKSVSRKELDRQERLYEVFYGEKDYVRDLCILRDLYMRPLHNEDIVDESRRKNFITKVFKNALAILAENAALQRALEKRQKESFICYQVGDVFLPFVQHLESYLEYCANQPYSMHFLEAERQSNPRLHEFLEKTDRRPEGRKLGVQHFLTRPPTRLARYPLVLNAVLKYTPEGHPDRETIPYVVSRIEAMLNRINAETGKAQNRLRLYKVDEKLVCSSSDRNDLRLTDDQRKLVRDSQLRKRGGNDSSVIQVLLLDHMLLMCKIKVDPRTGEEKYIIYKHPIPLQLLTICNPDDPSSTRPRMAARRDSTGQASISGSTYVASPSAAGGGGMVPMGKAQSYNNITSPTSAQSGSGSGSHTAGQGPTIIAIDQNDSQKDKYNYSLQITHLGRRGFTVTLYSNKLADRQQWYQCIEQQQLEMMERHRKFELVPVACQFPPGIRINTADVFDHGRCVVIGTDRGLYTGVSGKPRSYQLLTHLRHDRVYQIEIHEKLNVMAMIADKDRNLYVYPLDLLMTATSNSRPGPRIKPLHTHVSFFRFGHYLDYDILCSVKSTTLSNQTIIHVYKPVVSGQKNRSLGRFLSLGTESTADSWKCIKECYIAAESTSLHFLRSRLCVGCNRGFEIVDLATMNTQSLLDPADASLAFINKRDTSHPISLFRVHDGEFLLCYDEFAFYVNRNGQRARSNWMIHWVGNPSSFKLQYPYILAFDSSFIEVYHVETAAIVQVIITGNCTSLSPNRKDVNLCVTSPSPTQSQEVLRIQHILAKDPL